MNAQLLSGLIVFLMAGGVGPTAFAEDAKPAESHESHHPEATQNSEKSDMMGDQMMDKMDMGKMHEMMHQCMSMHKKGQMCDHEAMKECQKNMSKGDCGKMMKEAKAKMKTDATKK